MKNIINYFYNFNIDNIRMIGNNYYFSYKNNNFVLHEVDDIYIDQQATFELNSILINNGNNFFKIITNIDNQIVTHYLNKKYVLLMDMVKQDRTFDYYDILNTNIVINDIDKKNNRLNRANWGDLWKIKVDYFESFIEHNFNKYPLLNKYYNYFIGMAENAISYYSDTIIDVKPTMYDKIVISHKRIENHSTYKNLFNPLELIIDHQSRDLAEYLKMTFFNRVYNLDEISDYIDKSILSSYSGRMFISRMLFPSFFFDLFEKLINNECSVKDIIYVIDRMGEYEKYIFDLYKIVRSKYIIPEIEWLKKADYSSTFTTPNTSGTSLISMDSMPSLSVTSIMLQ